MAVPSSDSVFVGWTGACSGTGPYCELTVSTHLEVGAVFRNAE